MSLSVIEREASYAGDIGLPELFARWFDSRGWTPRRHQLALVDLARQGKSALLIAPTGGGKTLLAAHAIGIARDTYLTQQHPLVLWLVTSTTIGGTSRLRETI